jgi:hypothetical protein
MSETGFFENPGFYTRLLGNLVMLLRSKVNSSGLYAFFISRMIGIILFLEKRLKGGNILIERVEGCRFSNLSEREVPGSGG